MFSSNKLLGALGAAGLALGVAAAPAAAEDREFSYYVTLTGASDYMFRGISFTDEDPTVNAYIEMSYGIAYLAFWTSNIDNGDYGPWEQDVYAGIRPVTGPITWDFALWYYMYGSKNQSSFSDLDYIELKASASATPITNLAVSVTGYYTPDQGISTPETATIEGGLGYTLPAVGIFTPTVSGIYGYSEAESGTGWFLGEDDYTYWNAGLKLAVEKWAFDFRYWDTSINDGLADERFVFSASITLP
jgi:uncharacterized protein (TIGR02001 family)